MNMRLEVTIGSDEPIIYSLSESKIQVGSGDSCDISLPSSKGISRKHLEIKIEGEKVFVADLGSSNGSFINEERLVPGAKKEFTSFFPVKLAEDVYISLLTDEEMGNAAPAMLITIPEVGKKASGTDTKIEINDKKKISSSIKSTSHKPGPTKIIKNPLPKGKKKPEPKMNTSTAMVALILGGALAYHYYGTKNIEVPQPLAVEAKPKEETQQANLKEKITPKALSLIPSNEVPSFNTFDKILGEIKCATTLEKKICDLIPDSFGLSGGVVESVDNVTIIVPEKKWYALTMDVLPSSDLTLRAKLIAILFLRSLPAIDPNLTDKNIFIVFYRVIDSTPVAATIIGVRPQEIAPFQEVTPLDLARELRLKSGRDIPQYVKFFSIIQGTREPEAVIGTETTAAQNPAATPVAAALPTPGRVPPPAPVRPPIVPQIQRNTEERYRSTPQRPMPGPPEGRPRPAIRQNPAVAPTPAPLRDSDRAPIPFDMPSNPEDSPNQ
jgi:hypothetical protein